MRLEAWQTEDWRKLREVRLSPYRRGMGPTFILRTYDGHVQGARYYGGKSTIAYRLTMREHGRTVTLFEGADFHPSPLCADDSDGSIAALLGFLTLRKGDTDDEYFADYTQIQTDFSEQHAESLSAAAIDRFGED